MLKADIRSGLKCKRRSQGFDCVLRVTQHTGTLDWIPTVNYIYRYPFPIFYANFELKKSERFIVIHQGRVVQILNASMFCFLLTYSVTVQSVTDWDQ